MHKRNIAALRNLPLFIVVGLSLIGFTIRPVEANDGIFPPAPTAASAINFDGKGFIINGQRTFIASGGMEYARVPKELWRDRLLRMKRAGFNCTEMYVFWNFHEPKEDQWNFTGDHDLNAYLQLVHQLGMYAIVRIGPYVCAEWDSGGWPVWLRFKPGVIVRADNAPYLDEVFKYYDKVVPIVAANQINHGGSVILVQIENEDKDGWGTDSSLYERKLRERVLADGIEVPTFFSGLHHGNDPAGNVPWDDATRTNPWFTTEFWCDWYNDYGPSNPTAKARDTWKILAFGGNGYNYYMLHGGSNFGFYNDNEDASSYDYGAAIGQTGDLRPTYYKFKEAAMFAATFQSILENNVSSTAHFSSIANNPAINVYARTGPAGTISFLDNPTSHDVTTQVTGGHNALEPVLPATVPAKLMLPVIQNYQVTPSITIDQSVTQILTSVTNGGNTTLVVYGPAGGSGSIELSATSPLSLISGSGYAATDASHGSLQFTYPAAGTSSIILGSGSDKLQILALNEYLADRTWTIAALDGMHLIVGPDYVGDGDFTGGKEIFHCEFFPGAADAASLAPGTVIDFQPSLVAGTLQHSDQATAFPTAPTLTGWQQNIVGESALNFDDSNWLTQDQPPLMGADGDYSAYAWYRTKITAAATGIQYLVPTKVGDRMIVFVDGVRVPAAGVTTTSAALNLTAGPHTLAILTAHYGRNKLFEYSGPLNTIDPKGLEAPVSLSPAPNLSLTSWQSLPVEVQQPDTTAVPSPTDTNWQPVKLGADVFNHQSGWDWFQTIVPAASVGAGTDQSVHFDNVDDNATVFCNGHQVGTHKGWKTGFDLDLSAAWLPGQNNVITVLDQNIDGAGGISGAVTLSTVSLNSTLHGWKMRGGIGDPQSLTHGAPLSTQSTPALPAFFQAHFVGSPPGIIGAHPILRIHLGGMSAGFVWLNGHNLGRYPEKIPVDGLYLPECWINRGDNVVAIFDEDGDQPTGVSLINEMGASRTEFTAKN